MFFLTRRADMVRMRPVRDKALLKPPEGMGASGGQ